MAIDKRHLDQYNGLVDGYYGFYEYFDEEILINIDYAGKLACYVFSRLNDRRYIIFYKFSYNKKESKAQSAKEKEPFTILSPLLGLALNYTN